MNGSDPPPRTPPDRVKGRAHEATSPRPDQDKTSTATTQRIGSGPATGTAGGSVPESRPESGPKPPGGLSDWLAPTVVERNRGTAVDRMARSTRRDRAPITGPKIPALSEPEPGRTEDVETVVWQGTDPRIAVPADDGGMILAERYRVISGLAKGGIARILKVKHVTLGKEFALKILSKKTAVDPKTRQNFFREARVSSQMDHPNIVQVTDFGIDPKYGAYIVMEYLKGETLRDRLAREKKLQLGPALDIARQTAEALNYMHGLDIIHCDIKAENIFLCRPPADQRQRRVVKLIDFGLSRSAAMGTTLARSEVGGTPQYVAPEQIQGLAPQPSMDIYSLGVLLYEMITGSHPFAGTTAELLHAHQHEIPAPPSAVIGEPLGAQVERLVLKALAKKPDDRQPSMAQVIFELRTTMDMLGFTPARRGAAVQQSRPGRGMDQLRPIFDHCPCPLFRLDSNGTLLAANPAFCDFVRAKPVQILGSSIDRTRLGNVYPEIKKDLASAVQSRRRASLHKVAVVPKGPKAQVSVMIGLTPESDDSGRVTHFVGVIHRLSVT